MTALAVALAVALVLLGVSVVGAPVGAGAPAARAAAVGDDVRGTEGADAGPGCPAGYLALTLDGGPEPGVADRFVRTLRRLRAPATFFLIGREVVKHPEVARLIAARGFTVGNHSFHHHDMAVMSPDQVRTEVESTDAALRAAGVTPSRYFRFPFGSRTPGVQREVERLGYTVAGWNVASFDNPAHSFRAITARVLRQLSRPGAPRSATLLLHDGRPKDVAVTLRALPRIVRGARALGYCTGTLHDDGGRLPMAVAGP